MAFSEKEEIEDNFIGLNIFGKYKLIEKLGQGSFGSIYKSQSKDSKKFYAVKIEDMRDEEYVLEDESKYLSYLNVKRVPKVKYFGYYGTYIILVMELLGKSLDKIFSELPTKKMSVRCVCNIAYQLLTIFEKIHNNDIIHRDIKPGNIAVGLEENNKFLYVLDFGLAKIYRNIKTKKHEPFVKGKKLIGNARYSSINALEGGTQSRRDDLESIGYMLIFFLVGRLPWQGYIANNKEDKYAKIKEIKQKTTSEELCKDLPPQLEEYIKYTRNLGYEQDPDYEYLKNLFLNLLKNYNWEFNYYYDWDQSCLDINQIKLNEKKERETEANSKYSYQYKSKYVLYNNISNLIKERKALIGTFESDRYVFDFDEETVYKNVKKSPISVNSTEYSIRDNSNSMTPYAYPKTKIKHFSCLPCQPKSIKDNDKDNSCCLLF